MDGSVMDAAQFKALRERTGLSQGGLADKLGVTRATINRWETGVSPVADYVTPELMGDVTAEANVTPGPVTSVTPGQTDVTPIDVSKLVPWTAPNIPARRSSGWIPCPDRQGQTWDHA